MTAAPVFRAILLHDEEARDRAVLVPAATIPPARLRIPTVYAGAAACDVYELVDDTDWPEQAMFRHAGVNPRTTNDRSDPA
ncbi:hypothetical protein LLS1_35330 [Leifsonia sp. LS1]|uniref:hypothetical protein n=1 Tax=Leifsonia sp. LS1 TaxID=2828483 RepID=UPI001CFE7FF1|nr:hypothetical protein [Leifsonia sp. LS1]GIT81864.1 hypothetical protein LLS1_35330 [Leifsonia sp. LS1]